MSGFKVKRLFLLLPILLLPFSLEVAAEESDLLDETETDEENSFFDFGDLVPMIETKKGYNKYENMSYPMIEESSLSGVVNNPSDHDLEDI